MPVKSKLGSSPGKSHGSSTGQGHGSTIGGRVRTASNESMAPIPHVAPIHVITEKAGESLIDTCCLLIYCSHHHRIVLHTKAQRFWLPFFELKHLESWKETASNGLLFLLTDHKVPLRDPNEAFSPLKMVHILRIQLPLINKFATRITYGVRVLKAAVGGWRCCRDDTSKGIAWVPISELQQGRVTTLYGPEPFLFADAAAQESPSFSELEFTVEDAMKHQRHLRLLTREEELIIGAQYSVREMTGLYEDFLQHCYPCFYMTISSFAMFMKKIGWAPTHGSRGSHGSLLPTFRAFNYTKTGYLNFYEILHGLAAFVAPQAGFCGEFRSGCIFRYYDEDSDGKLVFSEMKRLVKDILKSRGNHHPTDQAIEADAKIRWTDKLKLRMDQKLSLKYFTEAVGRKVFRGTSGLFRFSVGPLGQRSAKDTQGQNRKSAQTLTPHERRKIKGSCSSCRVKKYSWAVHCVTLNAKGQTSFDNLEVTDKADIDFKTQDHSSSDLRTFSKDTVFNTSHVANQTLRSLRHYEEARKGGGTTATPGKASSSRSSSGSSSTKQDLKPWMSESSGLLAMFKDLCEQVEEIFAKEDRVVKISSPCIVFGDIHGNLGDLMTYEKMFWKNMPALSPSKYLFCGDYVDRGEYGVEAVSYLFSLKILAPDKFFMLRGNHEIKAINKRFTFPKECDTKYGAHLGSQICDLFNRVFDSMPLAAIVDEQIYCAHGGIPSAITRVEDMLKIPCPLRDPEFQSEAAWEMLWDDPIAPGTAHQIETYMTTAGPTTGGFLSNDKRGTAYYFTEEAVDRFLDVNELSFILRGHEVIPRGWKFNIGFKVLTVFSSSYYCNGKNKAAAVLIDSEKLRVIRLETEMPRR